MVDVVYDACVLYSPSLRDLLLDIAATKIVCPHWSNEIHEEWIHGILRNKPDLHRESLEKTRRHMDAKFRKSLTTGYEHLVPNIELPDPNDRHVLAVAIHTTSSKIITFNLGDFPKNVLEQYGIEALAPDDFIVQLIRKTPNLILIAAHNHRVSLTRPPKTPEEYIATLARQGLQQTVAFLQDHIDRT